MPVLHVAYLPSQVQAGIAGSFRDTDDNSVRLAGGRRLDGQPLAVRRDMYVGGVDPLAEGELHRARGSRQMGSALRRRRVQFRMRGRGRRGEHKGHEGQNTREKQASSHGVSPERREIEGVTPRQRAPSDIAGMDDVDTDGEREAEGEGEAAIGNPSRRPVAASFAPLSKGCTSRS